MVIRRRSLRCSRSDLELTMDQVHEVGKTKVVEGEFIVFRSLQEGVTRVYARATRAVTSTGEVDERRNRILKKE